MKPQTFNGDNLRQLREEAGLTQEELSRRANLTVATVSRLERSDNQPSLPTLRALAHALNKELSDII